MSECFFLACGDELDRLVFGRRPKTGASKPREKISGAERLDLPCWMDLDLVSNLSIKSAVASQFKSNYQGRDDALQRKESHYFQNNKLEFK